MRRIASVVAVLAIFAGCGKKAPHMAAAGPPPAGGRVVPIGYDPTVTGLRGAIGEIVYQNGGAAAWQKTSNPDTGWQAIPYGTVYTPGNGIGIDGGVIASTSTLELAQPAPLLPLGKSGGTIQVSGDSLQVGNAGTMNALTAGVIPIVTSRFRSASLTPPTWTNNAVGGQTLHDIWVTHINDQVLAAADGNDVIINGGINDVLGIAGNDGAGPFTLAQSKAILIAGLATFASSRPNSRLFYLNCLWAAGESWTKGANGLPVGNNARDAQIQAMNAMIASAVAAYPNQMRVIDLYSGMYAVSMARNQTNVVSMLAQSDGTHTGHMGVAVAKQIILENIFLPEAHLPTYLLPGARADFGIPDWFAETEDLISSYKSGGVGSFVAMSWTFNRKGKLDFSINEIGATLPSGVTDGGLEGGSLKFSGATPILSSGTIYQGNPKTGNQVLAFRAAYPALASSMVSLWGLTNSSGSEALLFGIDNTASSTKFLVRETHSSVSSSQVTSLNADTTEHTFVYIHNPNADGSGTNIYDLVIDGAQVLHTNPTANFPTSPMGVGSGPQSTSPAGYANVKRAQWWYVE